MIDIHSHILPGIDDGARNVEESMDLIRQAYSNGVTDIIVTPHYMTGSDYISDNAEKRKVITRLKYYVKKEKIPINIYLGNEVFVENDMLKYKKNKQITTLNNSKYLLFELPLNYKFNGLNDVVFNLEANKIIPVIAHPERYACVKEDPSIIEDLINKGVLFQCNLGSFLGVYGKKSKEIVILLLKHHAITFMGSDIHRSGNEFYNRIDEVKNIMRKYIDDSEIEDIFVNNAKRVLEKNVITKSKFTPFKKTLFGNWK